MNIEKTYVMGILNITDNSFSDGGQYNNYDSAVRRALDIADLGADIIDIGAESTKPYAIPVCEEEEIKKINSFLPGVIVALKENKNTPKVSIDTYKAGVAKRALELGADIINDIGGGDLSLDMFDVISDYKPYYICSHIKGTPQNMQDNPVYEDVVLEVRDHLFKKVDLLVSMGMPLDKIILDPGIGFGKTLKDNMLLIKNISVLKESGCRVLIGVSRKGFIRKLVNSSTDTDILAGSLAMNICSIISGADIIRVHDVSETISSINIYDAFCSI